MSKRDILQLFLDGTLSPSTLQEIARFLGVPSQEKKRLLAVLDDLCDEGQLAQTTKGKYGTPAQLGLVKGKLIGNERGFAFLVPDDKKEGEGDYFVPHRNLHGALHQDMVLANRLQGDEVEIVKIIERGQKTVVGTFYKDRRKGVLVPDDKKFFTDLFIPFHTCLQIENGVKAVARITDYPEGKAPGAVIIEVLGDEEDFFAEELSIIRSFNLKEEFPAEVEKEAESAEKRGITAQDIARRRDFREELIVTIDGEDTRDIDDAISLKKTADGYLLGVHIADVTHYVPRRSALDKEAFERGTSVYFPDRVLPMLPKPLSNGICSLNEGEDRLTLSCLMKINKKGVVVDREIVEGVIKSRHKMTYTEIDKILAEDSEVCARYADVKDTVLLFAELTKILQEMRRKKGNVVLEVKEAKILFDGENIVIPDYERPFSYQIIEAFMVLANETVAEYARDIQAPFIYRVHDKPSAEKASDFQSFATTLGLQARFDAEDVKPYDYQKLLLSAQELPVYSILTE
ncbi:MAG: VacB/RNase II family 3'-5' exoribonuclease [Clostridia bacterium]|nr:VacB/RNase II family 3'-5' exoribonuclease [Clostridia bacterium]